MIHRLRPVLFLFFVATFFVTATTVTLYTFGYRFSLQRGIFVYTGSITIQSNPKLVDIKVDENLIPQKNLGILNNSIHIPGLAPGEHFIEVSAEGYHPWTKKTVVQSGLSTEFWNVLLTKEQYTAVALPDTEHAIKLFRAPEDRLFAVVKKNGDTYSINTLNTRTNENREIFSTSLFIFPVEDKENIEWTPESTKIITPLLRGDTRSYSIVDVETKEVVDLNTFSGIEAPLRAPRWDPSTRNFLFFLSESNLYRIDTGAEKGTPVLIEKNVQSYDLSNKYIYYLNDTGVVYRIPIGQSNPDPMQITFTPAPIDIHSDYALIVYDENRLTILERSSGRLFLFNRVAAEQLQEIGTGIRGTQFSDDGKKVLFFTENEISVYFNSPWEVQPVRAVDTITQIGRFSTPINHVQWTKDYEHVIFSLGGAVKIIELDNRDRRNIADFANFSQPPLQILSRFEENQIYFIRADIPAGNTVETTDFPQATGLFGLQ